MESTAFFEKKISLTPSDFNKLKKTTIDDILLSKAKEQMEKSKMELLGQLNQIGISSDNLDWVAEQLNQTIDEEGERQKDESKK